MKNALQVKGSQHKYWDTVRWTERCAAMYAWRSHTHTWQYGTV
ncbi:MAG: hypothetical protein ACKVOM_12695 [Ferruginibacter sp.]